VLVLDEATSALDNATESAVMEAINSFRGSKTLIVIAHRLSTIRNCERIYEVNEGTVTQKDPGDVFEKE
jgi:ABC-type bacteriocin/lantibiotic exporter with double-glycine peptidase domain